MKVTVSESEKEENSLKNKNLNQKTNRGLLVEKLVFILHHHHYPQLFHKCEQLGPNNYSYFCCTSNIWTVCFGYYGKATLICQGPGVNIK